MALAHTHTRPRRGRLQIALVGKRRPFNFFYQEQCMLYLTYSLEQFALEECQKLHGTVEKQHQSWTESASEPDLTKAKQLPFLTMSNHVLTMFAVSS